MLVHPHQSLGRTSPPDRAPKTLVYLSETYIRLQLTTVFLFEKKAGKYLFISSGHPFERNGRPMLKPEI